MKHSIQEPFKGIKIFSTLFDVFLHCCLDTSLNSDETCSLSCLSQTT